MTNANDPSICPLTVLHKFSMISYFTQSVFKNMLTKNNYWRWSTCLVSSDISMEEISRGVTTTIPLQSSKHWPSLKKTSVRDDGIRAGELEKLAGSGWEAELGAPPKSSYCSGKPDASLPFLFISGQRDASIKLWQLSNKDFGGIAI